MKIYNLLIYCCTVLAITFYTKEVTDGDTWTVDCENAFEVPNEQTTHKAGFGNYTICQRNKLQDGVLKKKLVNQLVHKQLSVDNMRIKDKVDEEKDDGNMNEEFLEASGEYYEKSQGNHRSVSVDIHKRIKGEAKVQKQKRISVISYPMLFELGYKVRNKASKECVETWMETERILFESLPWSPLFKYSRIMLRIMGMDFAALNHRVYEFMCSDVQEMPYATPQRKPFHNVT